MSLPIQTRETLRRNEEEGIIMSFTEIKNERTKDRYFKAVHPTGLTIYVYPKEGYSSTYAMFGTKYGSVNRTFSVNDGEKTTVPDGIAHYLEHKLFESEDGDAFARYAKTGASANAYTSFDKTCYLFSCTENFEESLEILLDFVQSPYFTEQTVQKEQGIIGQEIKMYDDSPDWRVMFNLLEAMYHNHPVKIDIAGTVESIAKITPEYLYECYHSFYNLNNMVLSVAGNTTPEQVMKIADKMLKPCEKQTVETFFEEEPYEIVTDYVEQAFPVALPMFQLGFKARAKEKRSTDDELALTDILLFALASNSSAMYKELMEKGLINPSFGYEFFEGPGYCSILFSGESRDPKQTAGIIRKYVDEACADGISVEDFEIAKKAIYGEAVSALNNIETIANLLTEFAFTGKEVYHYIDAVAQAEKEAAEQRLRELFDSKNSALSVVKAEKEQ